MAKIEEKAKAYNGNYKAYTELINRLEGVKDAIKKQNYGIAMDILYKPYPEHQIITSTELKESEDEKIRKDIINYFSGAALEHREEEVLAWLEKQDEQKPVDSTLEIKPKFKVGDTIRELETGNLFYVNSVEDFGYTLHYKNCNANGCTMSFKYEDKYELIEQKPAWSEEDEEMYRKCICAMRASACGFPEEEKFVEQVDNWLNSLKDRVQPKQEWSEEDEYCRHQLIVFCENCMVKDEGAKKCAHWLKSLKPQNTWKPSEEMLEALYRAIPENVMEISEDEMLLDKLYQGLKYGRVLGKN